jgi:hypothetical protein
MGHLEEDVSVLEHSLEDGDGLGLALGVDGNVLQTVNSLGLVGGNGTVGEDPIGRVSGVRVGGSVVVDGGKTRTVLDDRVVLLDVGVSTESGSDDVSRVPLDREVGALYGTDKGGTVSGSFSGIDSLSSHSRSPKTMVWFSGRDPLATVYSE